MGSSPPPPAHLASTVWAGLCLHCPSLGYTWSHTVVHGHTDMCSHIRVTRPLHMTTSPYIQHIHDYTVTTQAHTQPQMCMLKHTAHALGVMRNDHMLTQAHTDTRACSGRTPARVVTHTLGVTQGHAHSHARTHMLTRLHAHAPSHLHIHLRVDAWSHPA